VVNISRTASANIYRQ